jgi:hypothetical protein
MRPMGVLAACGLLALLAAAPVSAWPDRRSEGLWEMTSVDRWGKDLEKVQRRRERRCLGAETMGPWGEVFNAAGGKSYGRRVTIGRDLSVVEQARVWDRGRRYDLPWMSEDSDRAGMWVSRYERSGDPQRRVELRSYADHRYVAAGIASKDVRKGFESSADLRRLGDCPSDFRFMTLRELWRSIFQWWL